MEQVKITILGRPMSGKTTIGLLIFDLLKKHNIDVSMNDIDVDIPTKANQTYVETISDKTKVLIVQKQSRAVPRFHDETLIAGETT